MLKRLFDSVLAGCGVVLLLPLFALLGLVIKLDSPGPVFYRATRIGKGGQPFSMLKFRTMVAGADRQGPAVTASGDRRITRVGRWLRRSKLDELPQLINVLRGEMSLVGPRPEMPFLVEQYRPWQRLRLQVRPGLTGLWQILGRKDLPLVENIEYDFYYISHRSLAMDLMIMLRTIPVVLFGKGAY